MYTLSQPGRQFALVSVWPVTLNLADPFCSRNTL